VPQFVVLLRGVNVGKGNRVPMATFRSLLEAHGFAEVRTLLNSGNALFTCPGRSAEKHAKTISAGLQKELGLTLRVVVKSSFEFLAAVAGNTIAPPEEHHSRFLVAFSQDQRLVQDLEALLSHLVHPPERFVIGGHAAYLHCARGILESQAATALLGKLGRGVTTRNWATVLKLGSLLGSVGPNPSIERTSSGGLRLPTAAAHVER
jgi:uncharacterized protein (DUF1697 family)